ncbi:hypothetical protein DL93DRAFT_2078112 [Clavulina sp. PMI_390]|nr:hypothetical protein DL93DRAFT_2078112 [Clavulina sp. PMI_390]
MGLYIFDLRMGFTYFTLLKNTSFSTWSNSTINLLSAKLFTFDGQEGILVVLYLPHGSQERVGIFFQALVPSVASDIPPLKHLASMIAPQMEIIAVELLGDYIVVDTFVETAGEGPKSRTQMVDLCRGRAFIVHDPGISKGRVVVYNHEYIIVRHQWKSVFSIARLDALESALDHSIGLTPWVHIEGDLDPYIPTASYYDLSLKREILPVWCRKIADYPWESVSDGISLVKLHEPTLDSLPARDADINARFTHDLLPGPPLLSGSRTRRARNSRPNCSSDLYGRKTLIGHERVLSNISCSSHCDPQEFLVLTELSGSGKEIIHKPLFVRRRQRNEEIIEQFAHRAGYQIEFCWSELSGGIAVRTRDYDSDVFTITLYQV